MSDSYYIKSNISKYQLMLKDELTEVTYKDLCEFGFTLGDDSKNKLCFKLSMNKNIFMIKTYDHLKIHLELKEKGNTTKYITKNKDCIDLFYDILEVKITFKDDFINDEFLYLENNSSLNDSECSTQEKILNDIISKYTNSNRKESVKIKMNLNVSFSNKQIESESYNSKENSEFACYNTNSKRVRDKDQLLIDSIKFNKISNQFIHEKINESTKKITPAKRPIRRLVKGKKIYIDSPKDTCSICLDLIKIKTSLNGCKHEFCKDCIEDWSKMTNLCPLCKEEFSRLTYYFNKQKKVKKVEKKKLQIEEEDENNDLENCMDNCIVCGKSDNESELLVCDACNYFVCHTFCDNLKAIPEGEWKCFDCRSNNFIRRVQALVEEEGNSSSEDSYKTRDSHLTTSTYYLRSRSNNSENHVKSRKSSSQEVREVNLNVNLNFRFSRNNNNSGRMRYNLRTRNRSDHI